MHTDWRLIGLLYVAGLLASAQFAKIALTLEDLAEAYPGAPLPFAVSALSVVGLLFGAVAGQAVSQVGLGRALTGAMALGAALSVAQAVLPPFPVFLALRLLEGVSQLAIVVAAPTLMAVHASPPHRPVVMGLWGTFFGVGFAGSAAILPLLGDVRAAFVAHGIATVAVGVALVTILPLRPGQRTKGESILGVYARIMRSPRILAPGLGFLWHAVMFLALLTYLPGFLGAWSAPVLPLLALAGTFGAGVMARRFAPHRIAMISYLVTAAGFMLMAALPEGVRGLVALPLMAVIGLAPGASFAGVPALNAAPDDQARANGALAQFGNLGTALSTPLFAASLGAGFGGLAILACVLCAGGLISLWLIHRKIAQSA